MNGAASVRSFTGLWQTDILWRNLQPESVFFPSVNLKFRDRPTVRGENIMDLSIVADWLTILFLVWFGLKQFIPALNKGSLTYVGGVLALAAALFTALST